MSHSREDQADPAADSDSFFGVALAQSFIGFAFGSAVNDVWEAGEIADAVCCDRAGDVGRKSASSPHSAGRLAGEFARRSGMPGPVFAARWPSPSASSASAPSPSF